MKFDYRTIVWSFGGGFFLAIVFAQIVTWFFPDISSKAGSIIVLFVTLGGMVMGFVLDQYYKRKKVNPLSKKGVIR